MSLPMLQVALDNQTLTSAYETTRLIAEEVDIVKSALSSASVKVYARCAI